MIDRFALAAPLVILLSPIAASAQDTSATQRGQAVAERRCAICHAVRSEQTASPDARAAPFTRVAATSGMTELALQATLQTSHRNMPNLILDADEMRDVIAYILSLGRAR